MHLMSRRGGRALAVPPALLLVGLLVAMSGTSLVGCRRSESHTPAAEAESTPAEGSDPAAGPDGGPGAPPVRRVPRGRPRPTAECGHAVAFAGWRPDPTGRLDRMLICDPGDNVLERVGHRWNGQPREVPIHVGTIRPVVVLQPAGSFTITGAVVIQPLSARPEETRMEATVAQGMPDLSQDFSARWPGLCGPTSAADVIFSMASHGPPLLDGFPRGPSADADAGVSRLIAGGADRITSESLAGRMRIAQDGAGATNVGLRDGIASWLEERQPGAWDVRLDWLDDGPAGQSRQRDFCGRLAAAAEAGGGAVLCLWPGSEFADNAVGPQADDAGGVAESASDDLPSDPPEPGQAAPGVAKPSRSGEGARPKAAGQARGQGPTAAANKRGTGGTSADIDLPAASFPEVPAPKTDEPNGLPGQPATRRNPREALEAARRKLALAEECVQRGDPGLAIQLATAAVEILVEPASRDPQCRAALESAVEAWERINATFPAGRRRDAGDRPTAFD